MKYRVWRSLDRPSAFFGIRGRFSTVFLGIAGAGLMVAFTVGSCTNSLIGMLTFGLCCIGAYSAVMSLQGRMTERGLARWMSSRRIPRAVRLMPKSIRSYLKSEQPWK